MKCARPALFWIGAFLFTLWTGGANAQESENRCADPIAEEIRQALQITYDSDQYERLLVQCIASKWPDKYSRGVNLWIFGVLEHVRTTVESRQVFQLFVVKKEKKTFSFVRRSDRFQINWFREPKWEQKVTSIQARWDPMGFPVFGITVRANFSYKMESHWHEKFVLFKMSNLIVPVFSTTVGICDCRKSDEMYPADCFWDPICPGKFLFADISYSKGKDTTDMGTIVKTLKPDDRSLYYEYRPYTEPGYMEWSVDPVSPLPPLDVIKSED